jgi:hypothetical protein
MEVPPRNIARRALYYMVFISVLALQASLASAQLPEPEVTFIPGQLSAESSFVMIADPGSVGGSVRITWVTDEGYGHLPYINGRYMCYFSDTDYQSTCGPSPFRYPTSEGYPYIMDVNTFDSELNQGNTSLEVEIGGLKITPDVSIDFDTGSATILVYTTPSIADSIIYKVFDSSFNPKTSGYLPLTRITGTPYYNGSVELGSGIYYIAFKANSSDDFGGGIIKVSMAAGEDGYEGVLQADPVNIDVLVEAGSEPNLPKNKRVMNALNQTFEGLSITLPQDVSKYVSITIPNSTIGPYESVYYTINLHGITSSLDINTMADINSGGGALLGRIPLKMRISYTSGGITDCSQLEDGADCLGGICCEGVCQEKAECCVDSDCASGRCSGFRCASVTVDISCTRGTCITGLSCPSGQEETGETCTSGGVSGICCAGECAGNPDLTECTGGICCSGACITAPGADCCSSIDCPGEELCEDHVCTAPEPEPWEIDFVTIGLIIAVAVAGGLGVWWFFKKRGKKSPEEEFEKESGEEEDLFEGEEEFY